MANYPGAILKPRHGNAGEFGKYYTGSSKARQAKRRRKQLARRGVLKD